jgi:hypothetical protein
VIALAIAVNVQAIVEVTVPTIAIVVTATGPRPPIVVAATEPRPPIVAPAMPATGAMPVPVIAPLRRTGREGEEEAVSTCHPPARPARRRHAAGRALPVREAAASAVAAAEAVSAVAGVEASAAEEAAEAEVAAAVVAGGVPTSR